VTVRLVLFDLWGTLIQDDGHHEGVPRDVLRARMMREVLAPHGLTLEEADIAAACDRAAAELSAIHADGLDISAEARTVLYLRHVDEGIGDRLDDTAWDALHRAVLTPALHTRPTEVVGALDCLRAVKKMSLSTALVSNAGITPGFVLREVLNGHGLLPHLDHTVFSDEVEASKPNPVIFRHALEAFDAAPEEAVFVGDQPLLDVLGPQHAGIRAIQVGALQAQGITPDYRIGALHELAPLLRRIGLATPV